MEQAQQELLLSEVNYVRSKGCKCGDKFYPPAQALTWSSELADLARMHASEMNNHDYFSHYNKEGDDIADRAEKVLYSWEEIGENIAVGFKSDLRVMHAWLASVEHCEMIMHPSIKKMGAARVGKYWVQNFSQTKPKKKLLSMKKTDY